ncbi:MAG: hypothetical protein NC328_02270 [Muribaculum sp.]|nr:hypothetical protein [Muribaculum sp.]
MKINTNNTHPNHPANNDSPSRHPFFSGWEVTGAERRNYEPTSPGISEYYF